MRSLAQIVYGEINKWRRGELGDIANGSIEDAIITAYLAGKANGEKEMAEKLKSAARSTERSRYHRVQEQIISAVEASAWYRDDACELLMAEYEI
jgi:hypothetical protein